MKDVHTSKTSAFAKHQKGSHPPEQWSNNSKEIGLRRLWQLEKGKERNFIFLCNKHFLEGSKYFIERSAYFYEGKLETIIVVIPALPIIISCLTKSSMYDLMLIISS